MGTEVINNFKVGDKVVPKADKSCEVMTVKGVTDDGYISLFSSMYSSEALFDANLFELWVAPWASQPPIETTVMPVADTKVLTPSEVRDIMAKDTPADPILDLIHNAEYALSFQTGGNHYQRGTIQPMEFFHDNGIPFPEASCMKYLYRWRDKGGIVDLRKTIQIILQIIAMEDRKAARVAARKAN